MSKKPLVVVQWEDAHGSTSSVVPEDCSGYHQCITMHTVGFLLRDDLVGVSVANEVFMEDGVLSYRGHTFVPRGIVVRVKRLRV